MEISSEPSINQLLKTDQFAEQLNPNSLLIHKKHISHTHSQTKQVDYLIHDSQYTPNQLNRRSHQTLPNMCQSVSNPPTLFLNVSSPNASASRAFYESLGFTVIKEWTDETSATLRLPGVNSSVCLMIHSPARFKEWTRPGTEIIDAKKSTETLFTVSVARKEDVDEWQTKAVEAGGQKDPWVMKDYGANFGMYSRSFADLDGHMWEVVAMLGSPEKKEDA
jgi:predicted lactoylglutathione lyase